MSANEAVKEAGTLSPEQAAAAIREAVSAYDGKELAERVNRFSLAMMAARGEYPDLARDAYPALEAAFADIDFGKLREAVSALAGYGADGASKALEEVTANPVVIANLVGALPPVVNSIVRVLAALVDNLDLPPEILASALFNVLTALDAETIGHVLSEVSRQVNLLHAGNYILGGDEPRFRAVFSDFMKRVLDNLEMEEATGALAALGEDLETVADVLAELIARDPAAVLLLAQAVNSLVNSLTRIVGSGVREMMAWSDELLVSLGERSREDLDVVEMGHVVDSLIGLSLRFREANPDLGREMLTDVLKVVNTEQLELVLRGAMNDLKQAALANSGIQIALGPEEVGRRVNEMLAGFNRSASPGGVADYLKRLFSTLDAVELEKAARTVSGGVIDGLFASAGTALAILKVAGHNAWKVAKNLFGLIKKS